MCFMKIVRRSGRYHVSEHWSMGPFCKFDDVSMPVNWLLSFRTLLYRTLFISNRYSGRQAHLIIGARHAGRKPTCHY